jgi:hypothetical protein
MQIERISVGETDIIVYPGGLLIPRAQFQAFVINSPARKWQCTHRSGEVETLLTGMKSWDEYYEGDNAFEDLIAFTKNIRRRHPKNSDTNYSGQVFKRVI